MNRFAACTIVGLCISLSACKSADAPPPAPPPPPAPAPTLEETCARPTNCPDYSGKIGVPRSGIVAAAQQCLVVDTKTLVDWEGGSDVKTLLIEWQGISISGYCDKPPTVGPDCKDKNCTFDPSKIPAWKDEFYCLCYKTIPTATDGTTMLADPRLIIRR